MATKSKTKAEPTKSRDKAKPAKKPVARATKWTEIDQTYLAARLAGQFAREMRYAFVDEIARDSIRVAEMAAFYAVLTKKQQARAGMKEIDSICLKYRATVVRDGLPKFCSLALRFPGGTYSTRAGELMPLTGTQGELVYPMVF